MPLLDEFRKQLIRDEGKNPKPYLDAAKKITIGVGRNLTDKGLRQREIDYLLENDIDEVIVNLSVVMPWTDGLDDTRKAVLLNMAFQMGMTGLLGFGNFLGLVKAGRYNDAADEMLKSKWAEEQTPARANRLAQQMRTALWQ